MRRMDGKWIRASLERADIADQLSGGMQAQTVQRIKVGAGMRGRGIQSIIQASDQVAARSLVIPPVAFMPLPPLPQSAAPSPRPAPSPRR